MTMTKTRWVLVGLLGLALATLALAFNNLAERIREIRPNLSAEELDLLVGLNGVFSRGSFQVTIRNGTTWRLSGLTVSLSWNAPQAVEKQSGLAAVGLRLQEGSTGMPGVVSVFVGEDLPFVPRGRIQYSWNLVGAVGVDPDTLDDTSVTDATASEGFGKGRAAYLRKDYATALQVFRPLADERHSLSQFYLGILYSEGGGVPKDYSRALWWWHKAAQQGSFHAEQTIGMAYSNGEGVKQNFTEAAKWFRKAAESGLAEAQHGLALAYYNGEGVPQDDVQAARWFAKAAAQGYPRAQYSLGLMILTKRGVPHDIVEALKWLKLAARKGLRGAIKGVKKLTKNVPPKLVAEMTKAEAEAERRVKKWRPRVQPDRGLPVWW